MKNYEFIPVLQKQKKGSKPFWVLVGIGYISLGVISLFIGKNISGILYLLTGIVFIFFTFHSENKGFFSSYLKLTDDKIIFKLDGKLKEKVIPIKNISTIEILPVSLEIKTKEGTTENISLANFTFNEVIKIKEIINQIKKSNSI